MKGLLICILLCLSSILIFAEEVTFTFEPPAENSVRLVHKGSSMDMVMAITDPSSEKTINLELGNSRQYKVRETILGVKEGSISDLKVEYLEALKTDEKMGKKNTTQEPVKGKTYLVHLSNEKPGITDIQGLLLPAEEYLIVSKDYGKEENKDMIDKLTGKKLTVGKRISFMEEAIKDSFLEKFEGGNIDNVTVILTEVRTQDGLKCAVFSVNFLLSTRQDAIYLSVNFAGEIVIVVEKTWVKEMNMEGPLIISATSPEEENSTMPSSLTGNGSMKVVAYYEY